MDISNDLLADIMNAAKIFAKKAYPILFHPSLEDFENEKEVAEDVVRKMCELVSSTETTISSRNIAVRKVGPILIENMKATSLKAYLDVTNVSANYYEILK